MKGPGVIAFRLLDAVLNFFAWIHRISTDSYEKAKTKAFEHKLFYYAIYDTKTNRYLKMHDYDTVFWVVWFYVLNHVCKISYSGVTYLDLDTILHAENLIVVASYVMNGEIRHAILDYEEYSKSWIPTAKKIVFAYTDSRDDVTHEFERFKETVFAIAERIGVQNVYNILCGYGRRETSTIQWISTMTDRDFEEIRL